MKFEKQTADSGVSPVVGVILMVAITVILSAIIATFVLDLGGTVSQNPAAGVTFDDNGANVEVQVISMENADTVTVDTASDIASADCDGAIDNGACELSNVGDTATADGGEDITVTATLDGKTSVIQSYDA
jgi:flagellin-like protein